MYTITYKSNTLTINKKFRCVKLPINQIYSLTWNQRIFNVATFKIISGEEYKFIIFNKKGFNEFFDSVKNFN